MAVSHGMSVLCEIRMVILYFIHTTTAVLLSGQFTFPTDLRMKQGKRSFYNIEFSYAKLGTNARPFAAYVDRGNFDVCCLLSSRPVLTIRIESIRLPTTTILMVAKPNGHDLCK